MTFKRVTGIKQHPDTFKRATYLTGWEPSSHIGVLGAIVAKLVLALIESTDTAEFGNDLRHKLAS
jgi:hypothetical protein